jgi:hypothetical protein
MSIFDRIALSALILLPLSLVGSCSTDNCVDVQCAPAPPVLDVIVQMDTVVFHTGLDGVIDSVDTVVVVDPTTHPDLSVVLSTGPDSSYVAFETMSSDGESFKRLDDAGLPDSSFSVRARLGVHCAVRNGLTVKRTEGCCPYTVVGRFELKLSADTCGW